MAAKIPERISIADLTGTKTVRLDSLQMHPENAREGDRTLIAASLRDHGQYRPLTVWAGTNYILVGNNTWLTMKEGGWKRCAITEVEATEAEARAILLVDNRAQDQADYDRPALARMLAEMREDQRMRSGFRAERAEELLQLLRTTEPVPAPVVEPDNGDQFYRSEEPTAEWQENPFQGDGVEGILPPAPAGTTPDYAGVAVREVIVRVPADRYPVLMLELSTLREAYGTMGIMHTMLEAIWREQRHLMEERQLTGSVD